MKSWLIGLLLLLVASLPLAAQQLAATKKLAEKLFARENLVAWCIVPFDSRKRGPEERAAMLKQLGFSKFAYDYRAEHIPTFDAEMEALQKQGIELTAWWFPGTLDDEARGILDVLKRHKLKPQLWITGGGEPTKTDAERQARIKAEAARIRPIAEEAAKIGCSVALYNHGGWFGEPENQLAIIEELKLPNVGLVYNQHHGHDHLGRFPELLKKMLPHLVCLNLNGMAPDGERRGQKILPLGQGELDLALLKTIRESGYRGSIGILGHTQDDAEQRLQDNLDGLDWLVRQLDGSPAGAKPEPRTPVPASREPEKKGQNTTPSLEKTPPEHWGRGVIGFDWKEADSVDNRWNQTDIGPFLASIVPLAKAPTSGRGDSSAEAKPSFVAKGLSIKVGDRGQGTVCYDTQTMALRAGWTGGFLKFDPARYGLINSPQIAGELVFASPGYKGWDAKSIHNLGLAIQHPRVVLSARVDGTLVRQSPWLEERDGLALFTQTIQVAAHKDPIACVIASLPTFPSPPDSDVIDGVPLVTTTTGNRVVAAALVAGRLRKVATDENVTELQIVFPGSETVQNAKVVVWSGQVDQLPKFVAAVKASPPPEDLAELSKPGKPRWTKEIVTQGTLSRDASSPYVVDTITLPFDNPYKALMFVGGHDFFANGDIALCTVHGDVWRVSGVDEKFERLVWKRFATGLFQPLGLKVVEDKVHVLGRDQITRLIDHNGDGEADEYQCFCNAYPTSTGGHDYVTCLETNTKGEFHFVHATQGLVRVGKDGRSTSTVATGFRNPNGMSVGPGDELTVAPQEGEWTPGSVIFEVRPGGHYGYGGPKAGHGPAGHDPPLAWLPRMMDNSSGGQVWVTSDRWGPLGRESGVGRREASGGRKPTEGNAREGEAPAEPPAAQLLHFSYGKCRMMLVLRERVGDVIHGAVVEIPGVSFASGAMRGRFSPHDGQLYVSGLKGWASAAVDDGCLQRVRYTGKPVVMPVDRRTYANGLAITFSQPLDKTTAEDPGSFHLEQWNYRYSAGYGSPDLKLSDPAAEGHDELKVRSATLLADGRTVFLEIPELKPANQTSIEYSLRTADSQPLRQTLVATTHVIPDRRMDESQLHRREPAAGELVDESSLAPGVLVRFSQGKSSSTRTGRLIAWHIDPKQASAIGLEAGLFETQVTGYVKVPLRGEYQFHCTGSGTVKLRINGQPVLSGNGDFQTIAASSATLRQGYNRLELDYASPSDGASACRLWWTDGTFAAEPVPPTALYHDTRNESLQQQNMLVRGIMHAIDLNCHACHPLPKSAGPMPVPAPGLAGVGSRLEKQWIYEWLLNPRAIRPQARMPRMFSAELATDRQAAADVAAYLATLTAMETGSETKGQAKDPPSAPLAGVALFEDLGCIACHRTTPPTENDPYDRLPLGHVGRKFRPTQLATYLRQPNAQFHFTRMPDFALSAAEATALASHFNLAGTKTAELPVELKTADAKRGETLFRERRCEACHTVKPGRQLDFTQSVVVPLKDVRRGCLNDDSERRESAPDYRLTVTQRAELADVYRRDALPSPGDTGEDTLPYLLTRLRCGACHSRDHEVAPLRRIVSEESDHGIAPEGIPNLTWAGEKLDGSWMTALLDGRLPYRTRPWVKVRMPAFPAFAESIASSLAEEHGLPHYYKPPAGERQIDTSLALLGDRLMRKDGGLDCRSCHAVGKDQPTGDERTKIAQGINFAHSRERMRDDFYLRFVLDPPRHDVTTRMPKLSADGRTTNAAGILDGDARKQFEAIWEFIRTVRE